MLLHACIYITAHFLSFLTHLLFAPSFIFALFFAPVTLYIRTLQNKPKHDTTTSTTIPESNTSNTGAYQPVSQPRLHHPVSTSHAKSPTTQEPISPINSTSVEEQQQQPPWAKELNMKRSMKSRPTPLRSSTEQVVIAV